MTGTMIVWILAAGDQERWGLDVPKQLLPVGNELLLERTVRQVRVFGLEPIVAAYDGRILGAMERLGVTTYPPPERRWTVETALSCLASTTGGRQVVLLGDVVFTDAAMLNILTCRDACRIFMRTHMEDRLVGHYREIFALSFDDRARPQVLAALEAAREHALNSGKGKLREFYCAYTGQPFPIGGDYEYDDRLIHWPVNDLTDDIDAPEEYAAFVALVVHPGKLDWR